MTSSLRSRVVLVALVALLVPFHGASADAAGPKGWGALDIKVVKKTVNAPFGATAATAKCPRGTRVIGGGAYFHRAGEAPTVDLASTSLLGASVPLETQRAWYATGVQERATSGIRFSVTALCAKGISYTIRTDEIELGAGETGGGYIGCAAGETVLGGGAFFHDGDGLAYPKHAETAWVTASSVTHDRLNWYVHGFNASNTKYMVSAVMCATTPLKATVLEEKRTVTAETTWGVFVDCPTGHKVLTGGSFWANDSNGPTHDEADNAMMTASAPYRSTKWYGHGWNNNLGGAVFYVRAICIAK